MILSLDIGGMSTKIATLNDDYQIISKKSVPYSNFPASWDTLKLLLLDEINKNDLSEIDAITFSCPGGVNCETGEVVGNSAILGLRGENIKSYFESKLNKRVFVDNDSNCAALAELELGNAQNCKNGLVIVVGTGIGGALLIDNKVFKGTHWFAGEIGTIIDRTLSEEQQKQFGIPYMYSSTYALYATCMRYQRLTGNKITGIELFNKYETEKASKEIIDEMMFGLAKTICNTYLVTNPEVIIVGGAISQNQLFMKLLKENIEHILFDMMQINSPFELKQCKFFNDSNLIGAALLSK